MNPAIISFLTAIALSAATFLAPAAPVPSTDTHVQEETADALEGTAAEGIPAFPAGESINIREGKSTEARIAGRLNPGDLCYILADAEEEWVFVESGDVRGFVRTDLLETGSHVQAEVQEKGAEAYGRAEQWLAPRDNEAYFYAESFSDPLSGEDESHLSIPVILGSPEDEGILQDNYSVVNGTDSGYHVWADRTDTSNVVIIGDSRIVGVSEDVGRVSYNATVGAHYLYEEVWENRMAPIIIHNGLDQKLAASEEGTTETAAETPEEASAEGASENTVEEFTGYYAEMVSLIRNCLEKQGSCLVVIAATVNDFGFANWAGTEAERMIQLGNSLKADASIEENTPLVYYMGIIPAKGEFTTQASGSSIEDFNRALEERVTASGDGYIGIGSPSAWEDLYAGDDLHFLAAGSRRIFELITDALEEGH